ncbi:MULTISPECIES: 2-oxoglutarate dehydrogenase E1 component [Chromobacterium]|uniref:2-oxoglutarate dehydrogenase E1 component n=1 Tax=Chromobacterium rhizoryzae TaxID=1778675 RepID=A0AAD0W839_9NEIS|nr:MULTISPECIES: 2-oxoglutarate dehydrogenase E1 component [Chromobacterium]AXT45368.1 2-oxoglutarate dehydrogenase E1 component [Chromobacterium rhizoryzae]MDH0341641.1 2-oxoglutarate dehydrogenase E1 component [Chromobacterium haemolyticum]OQS37842.1 2-oxoglutarate dehydrogenase subunit E1 [Chromobacterium haemolyticum]PTU68519.1 2-oxoglutarate dehydrogenase E1 component [Chromobacterium haemolyticum]QOD83636.1 2-oxoglutarate dehydrogenase E1 component [Chromobacterium haemolyticum]
MMQSMYSHSYLFGGNAPFIEELYEQYLADANSVPNEWRDYFDKLAQAPGAAERDVPHMPIQESFIQLAKKPAAGQRASSGAEWDTMQKQVGVLKLISAYRVLGSRQANLDPLKRMDQELVRELDPATHGLTGADMAVQFNAGSLVGPQKMPLSDILARLKQTYCGNIGVEYMHITKSDEKHWVQKRFEGDLSTPHYDAAKKQRILKQITAAETLERYLHTKYVGQKRFSLEGGESAIAALDHLIQNATGQGVQELIIGMAHRGRLNVLVNTLGKLPRDLFAEFEGKAAQQMASGDVKYHMGFSSDIPTADGPMHVSLAFNPSHLEIVNPVVEGSVRARQERRKDTERKTAVPVLIHGDSAFGGLGVNQGTFNLSQTRGYGTGGTIHIVINNQVGFTTSDTRDIRSTMYCTDVAKMIEAPIFHVNGDDPEAVCYVMQAALDYRMTFKKDVVIDLVCYRKLGHNEGDDPFLTQPMMYKKIAKHQGVRAMYAERLVQEGVLKAEEADAQIQAYRDALDKGEHVEQTALTNYKREHALDFSQYLGTHWAHPTDTSLPQADIQRLTDKFTSLPEGFKLHPTVQKVLAARKAMAAGEQNADWGMAETLAYASLVTNGFGVRLSGEDSGRGTFSHRHSVLHDQNRESWDQGSYVPLRNMSDNQADFLVIDSILNEEAVLAYEYGYACSAPDQLVIWEAQFGDFANGAQVAIDQFISSGETKWGRLCGLTTILPHGYDGQGPEHSSARLERWLQLCAEHNMQVVMPSEASQMFHMLRRQVLRPYRKPLVIFLSKRLLRFKDSMSPIEAFTSGSFRPVIGDSVVQDAKKVKRVLLCAGQVYYDLAAARKERGLDDDIAIVRIEQLYPFPTEQVAAELARFPQAREVMWVQEEPRNQGAWYQIRHRLEGLLGAKQSLSFAGRPSSASPAVGYMSKHVAQLKAFVEEAMSVAK